MGGRRRTTGAVAGALRQDAVLRRADYLAITLSVTEATHGLLGERELRLMKPTAAGPTFPADRPFHDLPNVLMTPHVSGWTEGMMEGRAAVIAENIERAVRGEPPVNLIRSSE